MLTNKRHDEYNSHWVRTMNIRAKQQGITLDEKIEEWPHTVDFN